jgi:hypothetical protein
METGFGGFRDEMLLCFNSACRYVVASSPRYRTITIIVHNTGMAKTEIKKETVEDSINTQQVTLLSVKCFRDYFT